MHPNQTEMNDFPRVGAPMRSIVAVESRNRGRRRDKSLLITIVDFDPSRFELDGQCFLVNNVAP